VAASVIAVPAAAEAAPYGRNGDRGRIERVQTTKFVQRANGRQVIKVNQAKQRDDRVASRIWRKGDRFDSRYARSYRLIQNPRAYHLDDAPRGYRWVQSGDDAILVAITSGVIGAVIGNMF
jgi:Ni/Co efflux regulator RcnB